MHDVTAQDPKLLVHLKATRNSVPVPRHWCFKRKYLQGKRGIEKPPFELPEFIKRTGIQEMREALQEKVSCCSSKMGVIESLLACSLKSGGGKRKTCPLVWNKAMMRMHGASRSQWSTCRIPYWLQRDWGGKLRQDRG